jgi:hypothetical protein
MAQIVNLPDELLLWIASSLGSPGSSRNKDLRKLSLVSRQIRPIAQGVLHSHIWIPMRESLPIQGGGPSQLALAARTLTMCPHLAQCAKSLSLSVTNIYSGHEEGCQVRMGMCGKDCLCDWDSIKEQLEACMPIDTTVNEQPPYSRPWIRRVLKGCESALAGLLISKCPALEVINM